MEMPVQAPLSAANKAASTAAQRGINAMKRVQEQLAGKLRGHETADDAPAVRLELPPAHDMKQQHNRGHLGQRHGARPVAPLFAVTVVQRALFEQRLELRAEVVDKAKQLRCLVHDRTPHLLWVLPFCS